MEEDRRLKRRWYVLHTKSRHEHVVNDQLQKKIQEVFLPLIKVPSRRRDRRLMIQVPLFPGYLFVKTDLHPASHLEVVRTVGAVRLLGNKNGPMPVPDETIASLRIMVAGDQPVTTGARLRRGDPVLVVRGPFTGVRGTFWRYGGRGRVVVNIEALGQYAGVEVDESDIEPLPKILT